MKFKNIIFMAFFFLAILPLSLNLVSVESKSDYCANAAVTDISPSSVGINEEFTVGIVIDNCGTLIPDNIKFEITEISPFIEVKESLIQEIGKMGYSNSKRFLLYHMKTSRNSIPGKYLIRHKIEYGSRDILITSEGNFSVSVIGNEAELSIASVKLKPTLPKEDEIIELTLRIENFGEGDANSVRVSTLHDFRGSKESFVGTLESDEDGPAVFNFIADSPGEYKIPVKISYKDDFGVHETEDEINIVILKKSRNIGRIIIILLILAVIFFIIFSYFRTKKEKDKIIQQLLKGNGKK